MCDQAVKEKKIMFRMLFFENQFEEIQIPNFTFFLTLLRVITHTNAKLSVRLVNYILN